MECAPLIVDGILSCTPSLWIIHPIILPHVKPPKRYTAVETFLNGKPGIISLGMDSFSLICNVPMFY